MSAPSPQPAQPNGESIIDPADADPETAYRVARVDEAGQAAPTTYNGRRRGDRWTLRDLAYGDPLAWGLSDSEIIVLDTVKGGQ
ncbi:hypothetical protein [Gordonia malaquae]|uniref:hypothetical protein n=1 Tax=Gordonia malaquae TaxID=410332 RepID=UPI003018B1E3